MVLTTPVNRFCESDLSRGQVVDTQGLDEEDLEAIDSLAPDPAVEARLCWKTDPLKMLDFE